MAFLKVNPTTFISPIAMALHHQVDVDHSGSLNLREFILCMRKVREVELKAVKILGFVFAEGSPGTKNLEDSYGIDQVMGFLKSLIEGLDIFLFENIGPDDFRFFL